MTSGNDGDDAPPVPPFARGQDPEEPDEIITNADTDADSGVTNVPLDDIDSNWTRYFRYETAYQDQVDAIDTFLDCLSGNGYYTFEGACGTGKSLVAVTAGLHAIRDQSHLTETRCTNGNTFPDYSRVLVATPVKQQIRQFIEELRGVNSALSGEPPATTTVLRGRSDMIAYADVNLPPFDEHSFGEKMEDIRDMTRELIKFGSDIPLDWPTHVPTPDFSRYDYDWDNASSQAEAVRDSYRYDPYRAEAVVHLVSNLEQPGGGEWQSLTVNGVDTPYPDYIPHTNDVVDDNELTKRGQEQLPMDLQGKFDPFYAGYFAGEERLPFDFDAADSYVFDRDELITQAAGAGICPHEAMAHLAEESEVVIGNYNHLFDPETRLLTDEKIGLLEEDTIGVIDEAHQIEDRARDMLSASVSLYTLDRAINDLEILRQYATGEPEKTPTPNLDSSDTALVKSLVTEALDTAGSYSVSVEDLQEVEQFLKFAKQKLGEYGAETIDSKFDESWQEVLNSQSIDSLEHPLLEPDATSGPDTFVEHATSRRDFTEQTFYKVYPAMLAAKFAYDALEEAGIHDRTPQSVQVGTFWKRWVQEDAVAYHREVVLDDSRKESVPTEFPPWVKGWTPEFQLYNCIPRDELRAVFSDLGGGVLMSATLQPADVFRRAVGIDAVPELSDSDESDEEDDPDDGMVSVPEQPSASSNTETDDGGRVFAFESYPLRFPEDHRESLTVPLTKFTSSNRGSPSQRRKYMSEVRRQYADTLEELVDTRGNILVTMPSYEEANWAYQYLKGRVSQKSFYLDQSSTAAETEDTLDEFFDDGNGVIFTSARGTITEGVDYDGDKLHMCIAVGIPYPPVQSSRIQAIETAYDERLGSGFETALTIPAVRKIRQALGRVIRGADEAGVRVLLDERYNSSGWAGVKEFLSDQEQAEFSRTPPENARSRVTSFWEHADTLDLEQHSVASTAPESKDDSETELTDEHDNPESGRTENAQADTSPSSESGSAQYSKIYFGSGAGLSSWVAVERNIAEEEIIPLVSQHEVPNPDEADVDTIQLNFASELSASGWTTVEASVVRNEIEPIARRAQKP
jgi:DNA excision repair protein ERCC-2